MATRRRQVAKQRSYVKIKDKQMNKLYRETMKQVQEVNERLNSLERRHESGTWATGKLKTRIKSNKTKGLMYKGKRIKLKPKMTKTSLTAVQKATRQFLESATSTNKGIREVKDKTLRTLKETLNLDEDLHKLSDKEVEDIHKIFEVKSTRNLVDEVGGSLLIQELAYSVKHDLDADSFIDRINKHMEQDIDLDLKQQAIQFFNDYISS